MSSQLTKKDFLQGKVFYMPGTEGVFYRLRIERRFEEPIELREIDLDGRETSHSLIENIDLETFTANIEIFPDNWVNKEMKYSQFMLKDNGAANS